MAKMADLGLKKWVKRATKRGFGEEKREKNIVLYLSSYLNIEMILRLVVSRMRRSFLLLSCRRLGSNAGARGRGRVMNPRVLYSIVVGNFSAKKGRKIGEKKALFF